MLKSLNIENIAVIEKADIEFSDGLNVMTGETGAGKSIVVDAINAVLGERTSKELVRHGAEAAFVSALFEEIHPVAVEKLQAMGITPEADGSLLLTRRITAQGKSACRINGVVCTVSMMKELGNLLVNIHGQHDAQALLNPEYHGAYLDMLADEQALVAYQTAFKNLVAIRRRLKELTLDAEEKDRQMELLTHEIEELSAADIKVGEREMLLKRRHLIHHARRVAQVLQTVMGALNGEEETAGIETLIASALQEAASVSDVDADLAGLHDLLAELYDKVACVKDAVLAKLAALDYNEQELEQIEARLDMFYRFSGKYGETEEEMLAFLEEAIRKRERMVHSEEEMEKLNAQYDTAYEATMQAAEKLSAQRRKTAVALEQEVQAQLAYLDMPKIRFIVQFEQGNLSANGYDKIEFLIATNVGEPPKPLAKIASGGELSRIMLAIKNILAAQDSVGTLIFDEIDSGVSGRASRKIGLRLKTVSAHTQVICVTHSAQIASAADTHLLIQKEVENGRTYTSVQPLDNEARKYELARIMGGLEITEALLQSAEELLQGIESEN